MTWGIPEKGTKITKQQLKIQGTYDGDDGVWEPVTIRSNPVTPAACDTPENGIWFKAVLLGIQKN